MDIEDHEPNDIKWIGKYLDEDGVVADILERVSADAVAVKRWLDPASWAMPNITALYMRGPRPASVPEHAGCLLFAAMNIRNFYGMWHADNPHTESEDVVIEDGVVTDQRHPDNFSFRVIERVKAELAKLVPEAA